MGSSSKGWILLLVTYTHMPILEPLDYKLDTQQGPNGVLYIHTITSNMAFFILVIK